MIVVAIEIDQDRCRAPKGNGPDQRASESEALSKVAVDLPPES